MKIRTRSKIQDMYKRQGATREQETRLGNTEYETGQEKRQDTEVWESERKNSNGR